MSATIWCMTPASKEQGDDMDHSLFLDAAEYLDEVAVKLGSRKPSDFFDYTDMQLNLADEGEEDSTLQETWHSPVEVVACLDALVQHLDTVSKTPFSEDDREALLEELRDCRQKAQAAVKAGEGFHFCIVM